MTTCAICGVRPPGGAPPATWTSQVDESGAVERICDACTREYLTAMEGRFDLHSWDAGWDAEPADAAGGRRA